MGYGKLAPAPLICCACAATTAPSTPTARRITRIVSERTPRITRRTDFIELSFCGPGTGPARVKLCVTAVLLTRSPDSSGLEADEGVQENLLLRRLGGRVVGERHVLDVEQQCKRHASNLREPVGDATDGPLVDALARDSAGSDRRDLVVRLHVVVAQQRLHRRPVGEHLLRRAPDRPALPVQVLGAGFRR